VPNSRCQHLNFEVTRYAHPAIFSEAPEGVIVSFLDVPEAITRGATCVEARERAGDALIGALSIYVEEGRHSPKPSAVRGREVVAVTAPGTIKLALHDGVLEAVVPTMKLLNKDKKVASEFVEDRTHPWTEQSILSLEQITVGHASYKIANDAQASAGGLES
jgi:antitoxin HicB